MSETDKNVETLIDGEASESDDEDAELSRSHKTAEAEGIVVSGEASESDASENEEQFKLPPLKIDQNKQFDEVINGDEDSQVPASISRPEGCNSASKFDSPFHRKLRERNATFRKHIEDPSKRMYSTAAKDLHNIAVQLSKTHTCIQDVSYNMRLLTNDLFHLEDKIDIVSSCTILPEIINT